MFTPLRYWFSHGAPEFRTPADSPARVVGQRAIPSANEHRQRVAQAVRTLRDGQLRKLVLSRAMAFELDKPADPEVLLSRFIAHSGTGHGHLVDLSSAGPTHARQWLVGSSPELLIYKRGPYIESHPLAGTAPRSVDPVEDQARATELMLSAKDLDEHSYVTREIRRVLEPLCTELIIPARPSLTRTAFTWHLGTRITGQLKDPKVSALELAQALHPTPAVAGFPSAEAREELARREPDRGFYAGAVGWSDSAGNGEWRVVIRSAVVAGTQVIAHAGGGLVATSDPDVEVAETSTKLGPVRAALGVDTLDGLSHKEG
nr:isochorismate synthase [Corynebacterium sp. c6VSa_13]